MSWSDPDDSTAENLQAWQRFSEAWAKRDIDGLMALVTDDIVYGASVGPEPGATLRGRWRSRIRFAGGSWLRAAHRAEGFPAAVRELLQHDQHRAPNLLHLRHPASRRTKSCRNATRLPSHPPEKSSPWFSGT
jgi:hypothetical protein